MYHNNVKGNAWQPVMKISTLIHFPSYIRRLPGWPVVGICIAVGLPSTRGAHPKNFGKRFWGKPCGILQARYVAVNRETFLPHQQQDGKVPFETVAEFCCGTRATLERSDLKSENIVLRVELRMPRWLTGDSIKTLVVHFNQNRAWNGTVQSLPFRQACAVRKEDWGSGIVVIQFCQTTHAHSILNLVSRVSHILPLIFPPHLSLMRAWRWKNLEARLHNSQKDDGLWQSSSQNVSLVFRRAMLRNF